MVELIQMVTEVMDQNSSNCTLEWLNSTYVFYGTDCSLTRGAITAGVLSAIGFLFAVVLAIVIAISALRFSYKNRLWIFSKKGENGLQKSGSHAVEAAAVGSDRDTEVSPNDEMTFPNPTYAAEEFNIPMDNPVYEGKNDTDKETYDIPDTSTLEPEKVVHNPLYYSCIEKEDNPSSDKTYSYAKVEETRKPSLHEIQPSQPLPALQRTQSSPLSQERPTDIPSSYTLVGPSESEQEVYEYPIDSGHASEIAPRVPAHQSSQAPVVPPHVRAKPQTAAGKRRSLESSGNFSKLSGSFATKNAGMPQGKPQVPHKPLTAVEALHGSQQSNSGTGGVSEGADKKLNKFAFHSQSAYKKQKPRVTPPNPIRYRKPGSAKHSSRPFSADLLEKRQAKQCLHSSFDMTSAPRQDVPSTHPKPTLRMDQRP